MDDSVLKDGGPRSPLRLSVPAKVNLWLEVLRKRDDGYHELSSLMVPVGLRDHLEVAVRPGSGIELTCDHPELPVDERNLAWCAARLFLESAGVEVRVDIRLEKNIPVGAGMGGGSADAAGVLLGLNRLLAGSLSMDRLEELALALGADVPFFLHGTSALATGIGERLEKADGLPNYPLLLVKPPFSVSTRWVYQSLKLTRGESRINLRTFLACPWRLAEVMENDLESVTLREYPLLSELKDWMLKQGALGALMSGSGPTVFGVFRERSRAEESFALVQEAWKDCWATVADVLGSPGAEPE